MKYVKKMRLLTLLLSTSLFVTTFLSETGANIWNSRKYAKAESNQISNPRISSNGVVTWDCVYFGHYWQEDTNRDGKTDRDDEKKPIKWRVLSVDEDSIFLLADQNLDCMRYNETDTDVTWENCTLRSWLNGYDALSNKI